MKGYDVIGDVHGCYDELCELLDKIGESSERKLIFVGDLIDRGPKQKECVALVRELVEQHRALCIMGNHEYNAILKRLNLRLKNDSFSLPFCEFVNTDIKPYYEKITIDNDKQYMTVKRKDIGSEVYIYGNSENQNTMNGCDCIIKFDKYDAADTIGFTVTIERDNEVFYEKHGSVPILNDDLKSHISVKNTSDTDNDLSKIEIFYTYIW